MIEVDLREYAPTITNANVAKKVLDIILNANPIENEVVINMEGMITMSIQSINIIFGGLYDKLGADKFHENILLKGCSDMLGDFMAFILKERKKKLEEENGKNN